MLDLGCAGGRNTVLLAERGFDVEALDASPAMVAKTRERIVGTLGAGEAERRVRVGRMDDLPRYRDGAFDLVVALGLYHCAQSRVEWESALSETARAGADGLVLVSVFTPETDLTGRGTRAIPGEPDVYEGFDSGGRHVLVDAAQLDREMARYGLCPSSPPAPRAPRSRPAAAFRRMGSTGRSQKVADRGRDSNP